MQQLTTYEKRVLEIKIKYVKKILNEISESQLLLLFNGTNRNKIEKELDGLLLPNNEDDFEEIQRDILDPILFAGMLSKVISDQMEKELEQAEKLKTGEDIRREELRYYLNNWEGC
jgi:hypothetical protein